MSVTVHPGSIFRSDATVMVCPVNTVGVMGAGLAKAFRDKHPDVYYHYKRACRSKQITDKTLQLIVANGYPYKVLMVPTKTHWKKDSEPKMVKDNIRRIRMFLQDRPVSKIAMVPLGAGLGGLDPDEVISWIVELLDDLPTDVEVWRG